MVPLGLHDYSLSMAQRECSLVYPFIGALRIQEPVIKSEIVKPLEEMITKIWT